MICPDCEGEGKIYTLLAHAHQAFTPERGTYIEDDVFDDIECDTCSGTGEVPDDNNEK